MAHIDETLPTNLFLIVKSSGEYGAQLDITFLDKADIIKAQELEQVQN